MTKAKRKKVPTFAEAVVDIIDLCMFEDHRPEECKCQKRVEALIKVRCQTSYWQGFNKAVDLLRLRAAKYRGMFKTPLRGFRKSQGSSKV